MSSVQYMPPVLFIVDRQLYYKFLAPVIDEVLGRGMCVICLHDYHDDEVRFSGLKIGQFPALAVCPQFSYGRVELRMWRRHEDIAELIAREGVECVYALHGPAHYGMPAAAQRGGATWVQLQHGADSFLDGLGTDQADIFACYSPAWLAHFSQSLQENTHVVGCPSLDSVDYDPADIRRKYALPDTRPVIVYFTNDHPTLTWFPGQLNRYWFKYIFCDDYWQGKWRFVPKLLARVFDTEIALVRALRGYADSIGAFLVFKSRAKRPLSALMCEHADAVFYDETYFPATNLELMKIASLAVCIASTAQFEAAYLGTPCVSLYADRCAAHTKATIDRAFPGKPSRYARSVGDFIRALCARDQIVSDIPREEVGAFFSAGNTPSAKRIVDLAVAHAGRQSRSHNPLNLDHG